MTIMVIFLLIHPIQGNISETQFWSCLLPHSKSFIRYNSSLQEKCKFLNKHLSPSWPGIQRHFESVTTTAWPLLNSTLKSLLPVSFPPVQLFLSNLNVLCKLFNLKLRDFLLLLILKYWSWIKEIRLQFCSLPSVLWWWLKGGKKEGSWQLPYL